MFDFKSRLKNKTFVVTFLVTCLSFIYNILGMFDIVTPVTQDMGQSLIISIVNILVALGVLIDPTTEGITDGNKRG